MIFPTYQNIRADIVSTDFFSRLVKRIYVSDTCTNVCPSIHVFDAIAVHLGLMNFEEFKKSTILKSISLMCMVTSTVSTVFIKQHSIIDLMWGVIFAVFMYGVVYKLPELYKFRKMQIRWIDEISKRESTENPVQDTIYQASFSETMENE
jgi:hypothetical protein